MVNKVTISADKTEITEGEAVTITISVSVNTTNNSLSLYRDGNSIKTWKNVYNGQKIVYKDTPTAGTHTYYAKLSVFSGPTPIAPTEPIEPLEPQPVQPVSRGL